MQIQRKVKIFSVSIFIAFASYALLYTQIVPYLTEVGYTVGQRGIVLSFYSILAVFGQIYVGYLSDKHGTIRKFFIYSTILYLITGLFAFNFDQANFWFHLFAIGIMGCFTRILANIFETWILEVDGLFDQFGNIRMFGSLGWAVASLIAGYLATQFGFKSLSVVNTVLCLVVIFMSFKLEDAQKETVVKISMRDIGELFKNKKYILLLVVYMIAYFIYNADAITVTDLIYELGGNASDVGLKWFVHALSEMPLLMFSGYFLIKYRSKKLMLFASFMIGLRFILFGMATNIPMVLVVTTLQALSFPFLLVTQKDLVNREVPVHLRTSGQMVAASLCSGFGAIFTPIFAAYVIEMTNIHTSLYIFGVMMLIPFILLLFYKPKE